MIHQSIRRGLIHLPKIISEIRGLGREHRALVALGPQALRAELAVHFAGWLTDAVRGATGSATDLSGARDLADLLQRAEVAAALLDARTEAGRAAADIRNRLSWAVRNGRHRDPVIRGYAPRDLAWAVRTARLAAQQIRTSRGHCN
ncbi:hypothetical protein SAMN05428942_7309 [Streptomyces sp. 2112.2]|uniref:hypothetical protein n=1 Tax=Streptomyces sp. 2112.2 TaxID=1881024 RepID=UPI000896D590|nr:hypothetical protein [Streptomyces sp. 2112.2]SEF16602.1 hypothetical protein SAMN05428942_7309 [Streptomyces sp. 2112.2]